MSASLEGREPFLDHRVIEFVSQLPSSYKIKDGDKKYILKSFFNSFSLKDSSPNDRHHPVSFLQDHLQWGHGKHPPPGISIH